MPTIEYVLIHLSINGTTYFKIEIIYREVKSNLMNLINLGLLGVEHGDKSAFFLNLSGNFREEARRDLPVLGVEQFEKSSSLIVRLIHVPNHSGLII